MENEIYGSDLDGEPESRYVILPLPKYCTQSLPGTLEKLAVMHERAELGESIFHPADLTMEKIGKRDVPPNIDPVEPLFARYRGQCSDLKYIPKCVQDDAEDAEDDEKEDPDPSLYSWWKLAWGPRPPEPPGSYLSPDTLEEIRQMQQQRQEQEQREREQQEQQQQNAQQPTASPASTNATNPMPIDPPRQRKKPGPKPGFRKKQQQQSHDVENGQHRQKQNGQRKQHNRKQHSSHSNHSYTPSWFDPDPEIDSETAGALYTLAKKLGGLSQVKRACKMLQECAK